MWFQAKNNTQTTHTHTHTKKNLLLLLLLLLFCFFFVCVCLVSRSFFLTHNRRTFDTMMTKTQREREEFPKRFRLCLLIILIILILLLFDHFLHLGVGGRIRRAGGIHDVHSPSNDVFEIGRVRGEERGHRDRDGEVHGEFKRLQRKGLCHSSLSLSLSFSLSFFLFFRHATTTTTTTTTTNASNDVFFFETKMHHHSQILEKKRANAFVLQNARL